MRNPLLQTLRTVSFLSLLLAVSVGWSSAQGNMLTAAREGDLEQIKAAINAGEDLEAQDEAGFTPLAVASAQGHLSVVQALLEAGADSNSRAKGGWTPLILASYRGHAETVAVLLSGGADPAAETTEGLSAVTAAAAAGHAPVVELLSSWLSRQGQSSGASSPAETIGEGAGNLLIDSDSDCMISVDGESVGRVNVDSPRKVRVSLGEHLVTAVCKYDVKWSTTVSTLSSAQKVLQVVVADKVEAGLAAEQSKSKLAPFLGQWKTELKAKRDCKDDTSYRDLTAVLSLTEQDDSGALSGTARIHYWGSNNCGEGRIDWSDKVEFSHRVVVNVELWMDDDIFVLEATPRSCEGDCFEYSGHYSHRWRSNQDTLFLNPRDTSSFRVSSFFFAPAMYQDYNRIRSGTLVKGVWYGTRNAEFRRISSPPPPVPPPQRQTEASQPVPLAKKQTGGQGPTLDSNSLLARPPEAPAASPNPSKPDVVSPVQRQIAKPALSLSSLSKWVCEVLPGEDANYIMNSFPWADLQVEYEVDQSSISEERTWFGETEGYYLEFWQKSIAARLRKPDGYKLVIELKGSLLGPEDQTQRDSKMRMVLGRFGGTLYEPDDELHYNPWAGQNCQINKELSDDWGFRVWDCDWEVEFSNDTLWVKWKSGINPGKRFCNLQ